MLDIIMVLANKLRKIAGDKNELGVN